MELNLSHEAGYVLAVTRDRIDRSAGDLFREWLYPLVGQPGTKVILDLSGSDQVTSEGIGEMMRLVAHANTNSSRIIMAGCKPFVVIVIGRCRLEGFFELAENVPEAIRRVTSS
jgi:anti-anti-sigma regulatory factor